MRTWSAPLTLSTPGLEVPRAVHERDDVDMSGRDFIHETEVADEELARDCVVELRDEPPAFAQGRQRGRRVQNLFEQGRSIATMRERLVEI